MAETKPPTPLPYQNQTIEDFSAGLNTLFNPRQLTPLIAGQNPPAPAESPFMQNIDIVAKGSIITSPGFQLQASLPDAGTGAAAHAVRTGTTVTSIVVDALGTGYISPPLINITGVNGVGSGATAHSTVDISGEVLTIVVDTPGTGYVVDPIVTITGQAGVLSLIPYEKTPTTSWQIATIANNLYSLAAGSSTLNLIGSYGALANHANGLVFNQSGTRVAIFGNDNVNNYMMYWDGVTLQILSPNAPKGGHIMEVFYQALFVAVGNTLYNSNIGDATNFTGGFGQFAGSVAFNDTITGLFVLDQLLVIYTKRNAYQGQIIFDATAQFPELQITPFRNNSGSLAPKSVNRVYNDIYAFSPDGVQRFGSDAQFISSNLRINSLSWKINPSLLPQNYNTQNIYNAASGYFQKKFLFSLPYGDNYFNSQTFVYNYDYDAWSSRNGILACQYSVAPDDQGEDGLYFGNPLAPEIYKFYNNYDYNGIGYERSYATKIFTMGNGMRSKFWQWLDLRGAMYLNTKFYVNLIVDGQTMTYYVDKSCLDATAASGYYGDDYYGSSSYGGPADPQFKRFGARIPFPVNIRAGRELQIVIYNQDPGQPWSIDYMNIVWQWDDTMKVPYNYQNAQLTSL